MDFMEMLNAHLEESKNKGSSGGSSGGEISAPIYIGTGHEAFYNNPASRNAFNKISTRTFDAPISQKFTSTYKKKKKEVAPDGICRGFSYDLLKRPASPKPSVTTLDPSLFE